jgi:hypothetical protein
VAFYWNAGLFINDLKREREREKEREESERRERERVGGRESALPL